VGKMKWVNGLLGVIGWLVVGDGVNGWV